MTMKAFKAAILTLTIVPSHGMDALHHHHRALQADNNVVTIITGTGVDEAELPNNNNENQEDQEQTTSSSIEPNYTQDQCTTWITSILSSDTDSSNGLSESEFHTFLTSIEEPPYVAAYFDQYADSYQDLPWIFQVIHKTLACRCQDLGLGEYCCEGDDSEVPFIGLHGGDDDNDGAAAAVVLTPEQQNVAVEYRADICNSIAVVFTRFIPTPGPTAAPTTPSPTVSELFAGMATTPSPTPWPPESGVVFECVDEVLCNAFDPSLDTIPSSSGWNSIGYCGPDTGIESCPQAHNDNAEYIEGDRVTIVSLPTTGVVFECANEGNCNDNDPSLDTSSGWTSIGDCGTAAAAEDAEDEEIVICPPRHDEYVTYDEGDQVTIARENVGAAPMIINIVGSVVDYSALGIKNYAIFDSSSIGETEYYNADQVMSNDGDNKVLRQVISGFGQLAIELLGELNAGYTEEGKRNLRRAGTTTTTSSSRALQGTMGSLDPVHVEDIDCPYDLIYAPPKGYCLIFKFKISPDAFLSQREDGVDTFTEMLKTAIDTDGRIYDIVSENYSDTLVTGLGIPGNGIPYLNEDTGPVRTKGVPPPAEDDGFPIWALILIILCVILIPIAIFAMYARHKKLKEREQQEKIDAFEAQRDLESMPIEEDEPKQEYYNAPPPVPEEEPVAVAVPEEDDESSAPSEWSESSEESDFTDEEGDIHQDEENVSPAMTAGSALAAMGAIGAVASLSPEKIGGSSDGSSSESGDDDHMSTLEETQDEYEAPTVAVAVAEVPTVAATAAAAEVPTLAAATAAVPPASFDDELTSGIIAMKEKQITTAESQSSPEGSQGIEMELEAMKDNLVAPTALAATFDAQSHSSGSSAGTDKGIEVSAPSQSETEVPKHIDEELLSRMSAIKESPKKTASAAAIGDNQVKPSTPPRMDKELSSRLEAMKESSKQVVPKTPFPASIGDKSRSSSRIDSELLSKFESRKTKETKEEKEKKALRDEITALVELTKPGKSAEDLILAYAGREGELIHSLTKLKEVKATKGEIV